MASARGHQRSVSGFLGNLFRGLLSGDSPGRTESGKRKGAKPRLLRFEGCEPRQLLSVTTGWDSSTGVLTLTSTGGSNSVSVIGHSSYVDIYVSGRYSTRITNATASTIDKIEFTGGGGKESLTVQGIKDYATPGTPAGTTAALEIDLTDVQTLSVVKGQDVVVTSNDGLKLGASTLSGDLTITAAGELTQSGAVVVSGATTLDVGNANDITLTQSKNNFNSVAVTAANNVSLVDVNSLDLAGLTVWGDLSVQASIKSSSRGTLSQSGAVTLIGTNKSTTLAVGRASTINLTNAANVFHTGTGSVAVTSAGDASVTNLGDTNLGTSYVKKNLTVTAVQDGSPDGDITQVAGSSITVGGIATFTAHDGEDIALGGANNFKYVAVTNARDSMLNDVNAVIFYASTVDRDLTVTAGGQISQKGELIVEGNTTLDAGSNNIVLKDADNDFDLTDDGGYLSLTGRNVTVRNTDGLDLGASTISGTLSVTAGGAIANSGALDVTGKVTVAAGSGDAISLNNAGNKLGEVCVTRGDDVTIVDSDGNFALGKSRVYGDLAVTLTGTGSLTQTGSLTVSGAMTLAVGAAHDITLDNRSNSFGEAAILSGDDVSLTTGKALTLGAMDISGDLTVNTRSGIDQSGAVTVAGETSLTAGRSSRIELNTQDNSLTGAISVASAGYLELRNVASAGTTFDTTSVRYNLDVTSTAGPIGQVAGGGTMVVGRTATFTATGQNITLDNSGNNFFVAAVNGVDVILEDADSVALGASIVTGTLYVEASKAISQTGELAVTGVATFLAGTTSKDTIVLNDSDNEFGVVEVTAGGSVTLEDLDAIDLGGADVDGNLSVTAGGAITGSGNLVIAGKTTLSADGVVTLNADNDFTGAVSVTASDDVTLNDTGDLILGECTIDTDLIVTTGGDLTQSGSVVVGGTAKLDAEGFDITLTLDGNDFAALELKGQDVAVAITDGDATDLDMGDSTITGDFALTTDCAITNGGTVKVAGETTLAAGTGNNITLDDADNEFYEVFVESGFDVVLVDADTDLNGLILGTSDVTGGLVVGSEGSISQDGALSALTVAATSGTGDVILDDSDNAVTSTIRLDGATVTLVNNTDTDLGNINAVDLVVDAVGQITDSGVINATTSSFTARTAGTAYSDIALDELTSDYGDSLRLEGHDISVKNDVMATLAIGNVRATGDLAITLSAANQELTNTPGSNMTIAGKTVLKSTGTDGSIDLYTAGCVFGSWDPAADPWNNPSLDLYLEAQNVAVH